MLMQQITWNVEYGYTTKFKKEHLWVHYRIADLDTCYANHWTISQSENGQNKLLTLKAGNLLSEKKLTVMWTFSKNKTKL